MFSLKSVIVTAASAAALLAGGPALAQAAAPTPAGLPSAFDFARFAAISDVQVSPDGKHIAALTSADGKTSVVSVWRTDALDQPPAVLGFSKMKLLGFSFVKADRLLVTGIQTFTDGSWRGHLTKAYVTDLKGEKWTSALPEDRPRSEAEAYVQRVSDPEILSIMPGDPQHILVVNNSLNGGGDVYKVNVYNGSSDRVARGSDKFIGVTADMKGDIRARAFFDYDGGNIYIAEQIRHPDTGAWEEHFRIFAKDREGMGVVGFSNDPNIVYVSNSKGRDKQGLYEYDVRARKIIGPAFEHKLFEAGGPVFSTAPEDFGRVLGYRYSGESSRIFWTDEKLAAIAKGLNQALGIKTTTVAWTDPATGQTTRFPMGDGASADIVSWSQDRRHVIVEKSGPQQPSEFYLLTDGTKLRKLGAARPQIDRAVLGQSRLIQYPARDGLMIPGFLHTPDKARYGAGPYPTVILPHGGPWSRDSYDWDVSGWVPYLVTRGYAVMQPQYRGSEGWGQKLWRAGDGEWGQKMQDDKDDGVKYLVAQKIADPGRVAMFGYSYGGYAAIAASVRPNGLYQCAISGAGLADLQLIRKETFDTRWGREFQRPTIDGVSWTPRAAEASIPILIYHGDRDTNVEPKESRVFVNALKSAGKPVKSVEFKDMGHGYITMTADHMTQQLQIIDDYLKTDCGPGGL